MLTIIEKVIFLQAIPEFAEIPTEQLGHIASITREVEFGADKTLIRLQGKVRLDRDGREIMIAGEKGVIGTWSLFDREQPNIATAVTLEPTRFLKINREEFFDVVADYVEIAQGIFKSLAKRVRGIQQILEKP